jgi:hypothetical protein
MHSPSPLSLALAACIGLSIVACSGGNGAGSDAGAGCPTSPPPEGSSCLFENGTTCSYGASEGTCGGGTVVICTNGSWQYEATPLGGAGAGVIEACPATIPTQGSPCSLSGCGAQPSCSYGCDQGGPAYATCNGSTWNVEYSGVDCAVDAAVEGGDGGDGGGAGCRSQSDCGSAAYCQAPGGPYLTGYALGSSCTSDAACAADAGAGSPWCNGGACVCQSTQYAPRPQPGLQAQGFCLPPCASDADCATSPLAPLYGNGTGFVCGAGGHCVPRTCTAPADCPADFDCAANQCVRRSCTTDTDCAQSGACVDGACYPAAGTCQGLPG